MDGAFRIFRRNGRSPFYQAVFTDADGRTIATRSTGEINRDRALLKAAELARTGILPSARSPKRKPDTLAGLTTFGQIAEALKSADLTQDQAHRLVAVLAGRGLLGSATSAGRRDFIEFLTEFWDYAKSPYVKERQAAGQRIGRTHCTEKRYHLTRWWEPFFKGKRVEDVTRQALKEFQGAMVGKIAPATIGKVMLTGTVALRWLFQNDLIPTDPTIGIKRAAGQAAKRGMFTDAELTALFKTAWTDQRAAVAALLASTTGMRQGECLALHMDDVLDDRVLVHRSWSRGDSFKGTKTGGEREVPLLPVVRDELRRLAATNPHKDGLVFYSVEKGVPYSYKAVLRGLIAACESIGISDATRQARGLAFHSFRHGVAKRLADRVSERALKLAGGWRTGAVADAYADHREEEDFHALTIASADAFGFVEALNRGDIEH